MILLVTGDRNWSDEKIIYGALDRAKYDGYTTLCHGAARGADSIAAKIGHDLGFEIWGYPAHWNKLGKAAGPLRNKEMLEAILNIQPSDKGRVLAFHDDLTKSKGTKHMMRLAYDSNIKIYHYQTNGTVRVYKNE